MRIAAFGGLLLLFAVVLPAQQLTIQENISIAPYSIPVPSSGSASIGMTRVTVSPSDSYSYEITEIVVQATSGGAFQDSWVDSIEVYWEGPSGNSEYDHGTLIDDQRVDTGGPYTFTGGTATISIDDTIADMPENTQTANRQLYVVFNLNDTADPTETLGCEVTAITYDRNLFGFLNSTDTVNPTAHGGTQPMDEYETTVDAVWIGPTTVAANESKVGLLRLDFDVLDATATTYVDTIEVTRTYGLDSYVDTGGVLLYQDVDGDDVFEPDADDGVFLDSANLSSGTATLDPANQTITSSGKSFFVAVTFDTTADQKGQDFGLNIADPSTDIVFADELEDDNSALVGTEYAYVPGGREYTQLGFITSTTADPPVDPANSVEIDYPDDGQPPTVDFTVPDDTDTGVGRNANITVVFGEVMQEDNGDAGWVENTANYELKETAGPTVGLSVVSYTAATKTLILDPASTLQWGTEHTFTVKSTVEDYYGNPMSGDHVITFTVQAETLPYVSSRSPAVGATSVAIDTTIEVVFSEDMDTGTFAANFSLKDSGNNDIDGVFSFPDSRTLVFTPGNPAPVDLDYDETYTVTVLAAVTDLEGSTMAADASWSFTTIRQYPVFEEPIILKNRIVSGGNQEVLIFVTEPPGGPNARVSVQVYTTTGKRVATLADNQVFSAIPEPIRWDGTNGAGDNLGPGLYFVQIRAANYKRVLKVMIVR